MLGLVRLHLAAGTAAFRQLDFFVRSNELAAQPWLSLPVVLRWAVRHALRATCSRLEALGT